MNKVNLANNPIRAGGQGESTRRLGRPRGRLQDLAVAFGLTAALGCPVNASAQTVKIGMISTYSGPDAAFGERMNRGVNLYMKLHQASLPPGVKVELITRDDGGPNPEKGKQLAQELIVRDHVNFLAGVVWTPSAIAIASGSIMSSSSKNWSGEAGVCVGRPASGSRQQMAARCLPSGCSARSHLEAVCRLHHQGAQLREAGRQVVQVALHCSSASSSSSHKWQRHSTH